MKKLITTGIGVYKSFLGFFKSENWVGEFPYPNEDLWISIAKKEKVTDKGYLFHKKLLTKIKYFI